MIPAPLLQLGGEGQSSWRQPGASGWPDGSTRTGISQTTPSRYGVRTQVLVPPCAPLPTPALTPRPPGVGASLSAPPRSSRAAWRWPLAGSQASRGGFHVGVWLGTRQGWAGWRHRVPDCLTPGPGGKIPGSRPCHKKRARLPTVPLPASLRSFLSAGLPSGDVPCEETASAPIFLGPGSTGGCSEEDAPRGCGSSPMARPPVVPRRRRSYGAR